MSIKMTSPNSKIPAGIAVANVISSYLFEQQCGELKYFKLSEEETLRKAVKAIMRVSNRTIKGK
jgi:hypothetical protein